MPNTLIIPNSGTIFFSTETAGASTTPALTGQAVSLAHDGQAGLIVTSLNTATSATNRFRVNGANGALLAVTDELTGTVFSVNDPAGLPIISADTGLNDVITIGTFGSNALVVRNDRVGIGTSNPSTSAALEIVSTTRGFCPPVMTVAQRTAIAAPVAGLVVYTSDAFTLSLHNGTAWGNVLTTHATSFSSETLRTAVSDETGTGSLVFAAGPTFTGPVDITSQDASTADRVMTRALVDARYFPWSPTMHGFGSLLGSNTALGAYMMAGRNDATSSFIWGTDNPPASALPFFCNNGKSINTIRIQHLAGTHPTAVLEVAIYQANAQGLPDTYVEKVSFPLSSIGNKTQTLSTPFTPNGLFWVFFRPSLGDINFKAGGNGVSLGIRGYATGYNLWAANFFGTNLNSDIIAFAGSLMPQRASNSSLLPTSSILGQLIINQTANAPSPSCILY